MSGTTSNLTNTELRSMFNISERSPLHEHIKQTSNDYLSQYQSGERWEDISDNIQEEILLEWKVFADKYGIDRDDMNAIKGRGERLRENNLELTPIGLPSSYGASGALDREIVRWNREECNKLMSILEYEEERQRESIAGIKNKKRKHKSKKKRSKKKRSKKRRSKRGSKRR